MDNGAQQRRFSDDRGKHDSVVINDHCLIHVEGDHRAVVASGVVVAHFDSADRTAAAHAMVTRVAQGLARQSEVARAFGCSARTLRRHERRFDEGGLAALGRGSGYPRGRARGAGRDRHVARLKAEGLSKRAIAQRLGVDEKSVRKRLRRLGWSAPAPRAVCPAADPGGCGPKPVRFSERQGRGHGAKRRSSPAAEGAGCGPKPVRFLGNRTGHRQRRYRAGRPPPGPVLRARRSAR
ncbi:MAG: helix-turn-helix domain-containing protein [Burkholderiales bacterium]|nr:helix-turn-helix domain-containing protein [Burkholderiales bacterium]